MTRLFRLPVATVDRLLNNITMYKVVLYGLLALAAFAVLFGFLGILTYDGSQFLLSLLLLATVCYETNALFAKLFRVPANAESWFITALILFFLFKPVQQLGDAWILAGAGVIAMASKYLVAFRGRHVFNPAAFAAAAFGFSGSVYWWIGTPVLLPVTLIVGLLIVRKIRRFPLFLSTVLTSLITVTVLGLQNGLGIVDSLLQHLGSWPIIFFASVMVTEPLTMPPRKKQQIAYGAFIGILSSWPIVIGPVYSSPELILLLANLYAYAVTLRRRLTLTLREKRLIAKDTYQFAFTVPPPSPRFLPGQYLEWTLPHPHADNRGNRRYFTIASSPTEHELLLGVKIGPQRSTFKERLITMEPGGTMLAGQLGGDFVLPKDPIKKLVFMAGGIGITPFRSMIKYLTDRNERRDIILFYANRTEQDAAYQDLFAQAERAIGLRIVYVFTGETANSMSENTIRAHAADFAERTFYLSGPVGMVDAYKDLLLNTGVARRRIKTDYFPGFA